MIGASPKQFFTLKEGDTAYTLQRECNSFGQYLAVTELKVGGLPRTIIIPAGKLKQGWRTFGIELRRILEPSQYALGGLKFVPYRSKQIPNSHSVRFCQVLCESCQSSGAGKTEACSTAPHQR